MKKIEKKTLMKTPVGVDFEIGRTTKKIGDVLEFKKGTMVRLDGSVKNVIQMYANGKKYAEGRAMRKNGEIYVKVTDILKGGK